MEKRLAKIKDIKFGLGGYQDAMIGLQITIGNDSWAVCDSISYWDSEIIKWDKGCEWTESDRDKEYAKLVRRISKLLNDAKVDSVNKLRGVPVEATFDGNKLKEWRVLTEVI